MQVNKINEVMILMKGDKIICSTVACFNTITLGKLDFGKLSSSVVLLFVFIF